MKQLLITILITIAFGSVCLSADKTIILPSSIDILTKLKKQPWAKDLHQIPATVIDKGVLRNIPYLSFQAGDYEVNIYGDPDKPACVEIGVYRTLLKNGAAKSNCLEFMASLLSTQKYQALLKSLNQEKDFSTIDGLTSEITPPTDEDAYGGWWVSLYFINQLNSARASDKELAEITVSKSIPSSTTSTNASGWTQSDMKFARATIGVVEVCTNKIEIAGNVYTDARIVKRNPMEVTVYNSSGVAAFRIDQLAPELQQQFGYDPAAAAAYQNAIVESQRLAQAPKILDVKTLQPQPSQETPQSLTSITPSQDYQRNQDSVYVGGYTQGSVYVRGYTRKNGTYVQGYYKGRR